MIIIQSFKYSLNKYNISAATFVALAAINAAQAAPSGINYAAAVVFSALAAVAMVAASRSKAAE